MADFSGTAGDDLLVGTDAADALWGRGGNDTLRGGAGDDTLVGGNGDDRLIGGAGADTYVFSFGSRLVTGGSSDFSSWMALNGYEALDSGDTLQSEFSQAYGSWLEYLVREFSLGHDVNGDGEVSVGLDQNDANATPYIEGMTEAQVMAAFGGGTSIDVVTGNHTAERFYASTFHMADRTIYTGNGEDTIVGFNAAAGDRIQVSGVDPLNGADFTLRVADVNGDGTLDTQVQLTTDSNWSVTLLGVSNFDVGTQIVYAAAPQPPAVPGLQDGTSGDDTLIGTSGNDTLVGHAGDDVLSGLAGNDRLEGGRGDDTMTGGAGADSFVISFGMTTVVGGTSSFGDWLDAHDYDQLESGVTTQSEFSRAYSGWLDNLVETYSLGRDVDGDGDVDVGMSQNDAGATPYIEGMSTAEVDALFSGTHSIDVVTGATEHTRYYSDTFAIAQREIYSGSGEDKITDFNAAEGDRIVVSGVGDGTDATFVMRVTDLNADGRLDTVFALSTDSNWHVTLMGVSGLDPATDIVFT